MDLKLKYCDNWIENRWGIASLYTEFLKGSEVDLSKEDENINHVFHFFVVRVKNRDKVRENLNRNNISTGIHYPVVSPGLKVYKYLGYMPDDLPVATQYSKGILSLPMYPELHKNHIEYVYKNIIKPTVS